MVTLDSPPVRAENQSIPLIIVARRDDDVPHVGGLGTAAVALSSGGPSSVGEGPAISAAGQERDGIPVYDSENNLLLPKNYREWVFVGSSLGLTYSDEAPRDEKFLHVYINPLGYRAFRATGEFPVGTMFLLEAAEKGTTESPVTGGAYPKRFTGLEAAVKSGDRFDEPWTYYSFDASGGQPNGKGRRFTGTSCIECHREHGETDHVFTQFYPVLTAKE